MTLQIAALQMWSVYNLPMREVVWRAYLLRACRRIEAPYTDQDRPLLRVGGKEGHVERLHGHSVGVVVHPRLSFSSSATAGRRGPDHHRQTGTSASREKIAQPMRSSSPAADLWCTTRISFIEQRVAPTNNLRTARSSSASKSTSVRITAGADWPLKR